MCGFFSGRKNTTILRELIEKGLQLNKKNSAGKYPLELLIENSCDCTLFSLMLAKGADQNIISKRYSILIRTVNSRMYDVCIVLLDAGANIGMKDGDGFTAFDIFASKLDICNCMHIKFPTCLNT